MRQTSAACLYSLSANDANPQTVMVEAGVVEAMVELLRNGDEESRNEAAPRILQQMVYGHNFAAADRSIAQVAEKGGVPLLVRRCAAAVSGAKPGRSQRACCTSWATASTTR